MHTISQAVNEGMSLAIAPDTIITEDQADALATAIAHLVKDMIS
jgi:Holliday junction resolvasome RuvABC endonuclease subunit